MDKDTFLIRDSGGNIFNEVSEPAVVFDKDLGTLIKIGEYEEMLDYYKNTVLLYNSAGLNHISKDIALISLPRIQDEIDKVFQISGYVGVLYKDIKNDKWLCSTKEGLF